MAEYIERGALCKYYQDRFEFLKNSSYIAVNGGYKVDDEMQAASVIAKEFLDKLEKAPAADVEPVKHGEWVYGEFDIPHCSECGGEIMPHLVSNYCPNCGAKMHREEVQE